MPWDYIFVGGGLSTTVASNRLLHLDRSLKILIVEAGPNANNATDIVYPNSTNLIGGEYDWKYQTVPQVHLDDRKIDLLCGKGLGGGTIINSAGWIRGDKIDFDLWGEIVNDKRWSYAGLLTYMKLTEDIENTDPLQHGDDGPMHIQGVISTHREFPLRDKVFKSWQDVGVEPLPHLDANAGIPLGIGDLFENRRQGRREISSVPRAIGIQLANGTHICGKEVILSSGAIRTPQLLMLSGIGPAKELRKHGIEVAVDAPEVGQHLVDHGLFASGWKIKDPAAGYAIGSGNPLFQKQHYGWGTPTDFIVTTGIQDKVGLAKAIESDEGVKPDPATHPLLKHERSFNEHVFLYAGAADGSAVTFTMIHLLPTSRGSVTLSSADVNDAPLIDPNYHGTAVDRFVAREGLRLQIKFADSNSTEIGRDVLDGDLGAQGFSKKLTADSTDDYLNRRMAASLGSTYHPMGTAAMCKVLDSTLRVNGVSNLRVIDTSVFPVVISAHLQVATYAMALQAADIMIRQRQNCQDQL